MTRKTHLFPPTPNNNNLALKWTRDEFNDGDLRVLQNGLEITTTVPKNIAPFDFPSLPFREIPNIITPLNTLKFNQLVETLAEKKTKKKKTKNTDLVRGAPPAGAGRPGTKKKKTLAAVVRRLIISTLVLM